MVKSDKYSDEKQKQDEYIKPVYRKPPVIRRWENLIKEFQRCSLIVVEIKIVWSPSQEGAECGIAYHRDKRHTSDKG